MFDPVPCLLANRHGASAARLNGVSLLLIPVTQLILESLECTQKVCMPDTRVPPMPHAREILDCGFNFNNRAALPVAQDLGHQGLAQLRDTMVKVAVMTASLSPTK